MKVNLPAPSAEEARERGKKGGTASGEARRKKKAMREMAELVLAAPMPVTKAQAKMLGNIGFDNEDANVQLMTLLAIAKKAAKGDLASAEFLRDTAGEKPTNKLDLTSDIVLEFGGEGDGS